MKVNPLKLTDLAQIVNARQGPSLTLVLSAGREGLWSPEAQSRLTRLLEDAEAQIARHYPTAARGQILEVFNHYDDLKKTHPHAGALCFFVSEGLAAYLPLAAEGETPADRAVVGDVFQIAPILDDINPMKSWFLAKLTKTGLRLYRGRGRTLEEIDEKHVGRDRSLEAPPAKKGEPPRFVKFHFEEHEALDAFLEERIESTERGFPVVLAGAKTDTDAYSRDSVHTFDLTVNICERYKECTPARLLSAVWPKLSDFFDQDRKMALAGLARALECGLTTSDLRQIIARLNAGSLRLMAILRESQAGRRMLTQDYDALIRQAIEKGCKILFCSASELPSGFTLLAV